MASKKEVSYVHVDKGRVDEVFEDVEDVKCLNSQDSDNKTIIVQHTEQQRNSTRHDVDHLIGVSEA